MIFDEVKNYLNVTWTDTDTDSKITGIIERSAAIIAEYAGVILTAETLAGNDKQLFLDLCRYIYNNAYEYFVKNFMGDITAMRQKYALAAFKEAEGIA